MRARSRLGALALLRARWNELLDQALYTIAAEGVWRRGDEWTADRR